MKNIGNIIIGVFLAAVTVWLIGFTAPRLYQIYKDIRNTEIKTDTVVKTDTLYLDKLFIDSVPKVKYVTVTHRDTVYGKEGDSLVAYPMVVKKNYIRKQRLWEMIH